MTDAYKIIDQVQKRIDESHAETARVMAQVFNEWRKRDAELSARCHKYANGEL